MTPYFWRIFNAIQMSSPVPARMRTALLRTVGCDLHPSVRLAEKVHLGSNCISLAKGVVLNIYCFLDGSAPIEIGEGVRFGPYVKVLTGTHVYAQSVLRRGPLSKNLARAVRIERGCWVGMNSTILPGVTIAEGCVIGACSLVTRSTEPNGLYLGNPARRVKDLSIEDDRFEESYRERDY